MKTIIFDIGGVLFRPSGTQFEPIEEGINLLAECAHLDVYVCTNYDSQVVEFLINEFPKEFEHVKGFVTPDRAGSKKPNPGIFQYLIKQYPIIPHESVFIDDSLHNIIAAKDAGFTGIHAADMSLVKAELRSLGLW